MQDHQILSDPKLLVRNELEGMGLDLDKIQMPTRVYIAMSGIINDFIQKDAVVDSGIPIAGKLFRFKNNPTVGLVKSNVGSPGIAVQAEDLIACGVKELIHLGYAGGLSTELTPGQLFLTTGAFNETGIAGLYGFNDQMVYPDLQLVDELNDSLNMNAIDFKKGYHWTTDAGYLETWEKVKRYLSQGAFCVEMEGVGLFSVANYRQVRSAAMYVISDVLSENGWNLGWSGDEVDKGVSVLTEAILQFNNPKSEA